MALFLSRGKPRSDDSSSGFGKKAYLSCSSSRTGPISRELPSGTGRKPVKVRFLLQPHVGGSVMRTESTRSEHCIVPWSRGLVCLPRMDLCV